MPAALLLGAVADDFTGAADLASMLSTGGVRTALLLDPGRTDDLRGGDFQAVVLALKTRSIPADDARRQSVRALEKLRDLGAPQFYFKYCSTFDSSPEGNIGPVAEALMEALGAPFTIAVPALPVNGRTQYKGYLFVGDRLLSETHMRDHPVHPMTEPNLVRHLQSQTGRRVGLIDLDAVRRGPRAIRSAIERLTDDGVAMALVDALEDADLDRIAEAAAELPLLTGGSGLGAALARSWTRRGDLVPEHSRQAEPLLAGGTLVLSGSCSAATLEQLAYAEQHGAQGVRLDAMTLLVDRDAELERARVAVGDSIDRSGSALVYSSAPADDRRRALQKAAQLGSDSSDLGARIESAHADIALWAVHEGLVRHLVIAGGETSGAVATALGLGALEVVDVLDPGVPILRTADGLSVTFKSGNFGSDDFFMKAVRRLGSPSPEAV